MRIVYLEPLQEGDIQGSYDPDLHGISQSHPYILTNQNLGRVFFIAPELRRGIIRGIHIQDLACVRRDRVFGRDKSYAVRPGRGREPNYYGS